LQEEFMLTPSRRPLPKVVVVHFADELNNFIKARHHKGSCVVLQIPGLPAEQASGWESQLNRLLKECGCSLGAKSVLLAVALSVVYQFSRSSWSISHMPIFLLRTAIVALLGGVAGKLIGLMLANRGLVRITKKIEKFEKVSHFKKLGNGDLGQ
jgi:hypothetical protein